MRKRLEKHGKLGEEGGVQEERREDKRLEKMGQRKRGRGKEQ